MKIKPICIVPARAGSKRIKNKNIINFFGKPLIAYSILTAKKSKLFSKIIVSTDSKKIKKIAERYGAECPYIRKKNLSNDKSSTKDVLLDAIQKIKSEKVPYHFLIYPTAPLITNNDLIKAFNLIKDKRADALLTVSEFISHPLRALHFNKSYLKFKWPQYQKCNSQDLTNYYFDVGAFYIYKTSAIIDVKKFFLKKTIPYILPIKKSVDLNTYEDLRLLKLFYDTKNK